ncbi:VIT and VWA domain-containing protein [Vibrio profundi]|uniref:VIT and vWA domain-containing protein n=1 Tax=Vibrio profundi TaxID=1774960 RepID=UPI0037350573
MPITKPYLFYWKCLLAILFLIVSTSSFASGLLNPINSQYQALKIQSHHVNVVIEDGYATTTIEQEFYNPNQSELEALYAFPIPDKAVVGEFIYWINGQPVIAEAVAKAQAEQIYQDQKAQGNATAITEKNEYKTFEMRVFPVQPQQSVKVRLVYLQDSLLDHSVGHYVYPMEEGGVDEQQAAFWSRNDTVEQDFSFNIEIKSAYPVDGVRLPKHPQATFSQYKVQQQTIWQAGLSNRSAIDVANTNDDDNHSAQTTPFQLNQDISVYWRLKSGLPGRLDMVAYRDPQQSSRGTVKLTFTPGDDLSVVNQGRDWIFILDKSGSMAGKYQTLVEGVRQGLARLPANDRFRVVMFNNGTEDLSQGYQSVTPQNVQAVLDRVSQSSPEGGTNLYAGLIEGFGSLDADRASGVVLVTDGVANVGVTHKQKFLDLMKDHDVRLFTFIMGNSANKPLLEPMTQISNGFSTVVSNSDDILGHMMNVTSKLSHQAYRNIKLDVDGVKIADLTPSQINSLYRGEQLTVFGHYFKSGTSKVTLTATVAGQERQYRTQIELPEVANTNPELERLWAFSSIQDINQRMNYLEQADSDSEKAIEALALEYGFLTDYTSLLVVEDAVFDQLGIDRTNKLRVEKEQLAREKRASQSSNQRRADEAQPMFNQPAPSHSGSGGGSLGWGVLLLLPLVRWMRNRN